MPATRRRTRASRAAAIRRGGVWSPGTSSLSWTSSGCTGIHGGQTVIRKRAEPRRDPGLPSTLDRAEEYVSGSPGSFERSDRSRTSARDRGGRADVARGVADQKAVAAGRADPAAAGVAPDREVAAGERQRDGRGAPRRELHFAERLEDPGRLARAVREADVELHDRGARARAGVAHADADRHPVDVRSRDPQPPVSEPGVGEAVAEGEGGALPAGVVVAVADEQALAVASEVFDAGEAPRARHRSLGVTARERHGQPAGGVDVAEEDAGDGLAVLLARVPGLQDGAYVVAPRREGRPAGVEHDDGPRVGGGDGLDERVLVAGQLERRQGGALGADVVDENDGHVGGARG